MEYSRDISPRPALGQDVAVGVSAHDILRRHRATGADPVLNVELLLERLRQMVCGDAAEGLGDSFLIPREEMYGEHFDVPAPDRLVLVSWFQGGEVFRSGCCYERGRGRIFYFRPGHETYPTYFQPDVRRVEWHRFPRYQRVDRRHAQGGAGAVRGERQRWRELRDPSRRWRTPR